MGFNKNNFHINWFSIDCTKQVLASILFYPVRQIQRIKFHGVDPLSFYDGFGKWDVSHIFRKPITIAIKLLVLIASKHLFIYLSSRLKHSGKRSPLVIYSVCDCDRLSIDKQIQKSCWRIPILLD